MGLNDVFVASEHTGGQLGEHHDVILDVHYDVASCCVHDATSIFEYLNVHNILAAYGLFG